MARASTASARLSRRIRATKTLWHSRISVRVVTVVLVVTIVAMIMIGLAVIVPMRSKMMDRAVNAALDEYAQAQSAAKAAVSALSSPTAGQIQLIANSMVTSQFAAAQNAEGAALVHVPGQNPGDFQIASPSTLSSAQILRLITPELQRSSQDPSRAAWMSAEIPLQDGQRSPGIIVGSTIQLAGAGNFNFYVGYSFANENQLLQLATGLLSIGGFVLLVLLLVVTATIVHMVVRPVTEASRSAQKIARGQLTSRMVVNGTDELAQLASSFNTMASSIQEKVESLEHLSQVQTRFVSAVSHELRTPVTTIRMAGQLIYDHRQELSPLLAKSAELQNEQLVNLDTMLSDLLEISRFDANSAALDAQSADLVTIVRRVVHAQEPLAASNHVHVVVHASGDTVASVDPRRIERIVRNLVVNGLEYADSATLLIRVVGGESAVAVEVSDHGVGLSEEEASHVFERFWRADESRVRKSGGTGLGLTIAAEDASLHGGTLDVAGAAGVGTTFLLVVPRQPYASMSSPLPLQVEAEHIDWDALETAPPFIDDRSDDRTDGRSLDASEESAEDDQGYVDAEGRVLQPNVLQPAEGADSTLMRRDEASEGTGEQAGTARAAVQTSTGVPTSTAAPARTEESEV